MSQLKRKTAKIRSAVVFLFTAAVVFVFASAAFPVSAFSAVVWESSTQNIQIASSGGYTRMCELPDGTLLSAYGAGTYIYVVRSTDGGLTWGPRIQASPSSYYTTEGLTSTNANIIRLEDGTLYCFFRSHQPGSASYTQFYSSIRCSVSTDNGNTWFAPPYPILVENTHKNADFTGFWEPHPIVLSDGKLAVYYANDCVSGGIAKVNGSVVTGFPYVSSQSYQYIVVQTLNASDGKWSFPSVCSDGVAHKSRDGMPVVCRLSDGSFCMAIESQACNSTTKCYKYTKKYNSYPMVTMLLFSQDGYTWTEPQLAGFPGASKKQYAAPFVVCLPDGRIAVSQQTDYGYNGVVNKDAVLNSSMRVIISSGVVTWANHSSYTYESFSSPSAPIVTPTDNYYGIWNALYLYDGRYLMAMSGMGYNSSDGSGNVVNTGAGLHLQRAYVGDCAIPEGYKGIGNKSELASIGKTAGMPFTGNYILERDINLGCSPSDLWAPIGSSSSSCYRGIFEGNGKTVSGLYVDMSASTLSQFSGLFGYATSAQIKNLTVSGTVKGATYVGGIAGYGYQTSILNCESEAAVTGSKHVGGIVGRMNSGSITGCVNKGVISGVAKSITDEGRIGGIAGYTDITSSISGCVNYGNILAPSLSHAGGIVGYIYATGGGVACTVTLCTNLGAVESLANAGGVAGVLQSMSGSSIVLSHCANYGAVSASSQCAGGVAAKSIASYIENSFNTGRVTAPSRSGGITGSAEGTNYIKNNYNIGITTGSTGNYIGAVAGYAASGTEAVNNYYIEGVCGSPSSVGTKLSGGEMRLQASYQGFDFASVWTVNASADYVYPVQTGLSGFDGICSLSADHNGYGFATPSAFAFRRGDAVTVTAVPDTNYKTKSVELNGNALQASSFTASGPQVIDIYFESTVAGDLDNDALVTNRDAAIMLKYVAGHEIECITGHLDVNDDGKINNRDAALLCQSLAGWQVELKINGVIYELFPEPDTGDDGWSKDYH